MFSCKSFLVPCVSGGLFRRTAAATVGDIKAASLKNNWGGVNNAAGLSLAFGTDIYRFIIKALYLLKTVITSFTLVVIDRHPPHLKKYFINSLHKSALRRQIEGDKMVMTGFVFML